MLTPCLDTADPLPRLDLGRLNDDVVELPLLLPGWQVSALAKVARSEGQSTGQLLRRLVREFVLENS
jgi:hypothetical protein